MPPSSKKALAAKPTLAMPTADGAAPKPTPRSSKKKKDGPPSHRPKSTKLASPKASSAGAPASAGSLEPLIEVTEDQLLQAAVEADAAKARAEASEEKVADLATLVTERTALATREAEGRAAAEKRAALAEEKLASTERELAATVERAAAAERAAEAAVHAATAATRDASKAKSEILEKEGIDTDVFKEAELRVEAETRAAAAEAKAEEASALAKGSTELAAAAAAEAEASAARCKAMEAELNALRSAAAAQPPQPTPGGSLPPDPVAALVGGVIDKVMLTTLQDALRKVEARAISAEARVAKAEATIAVAEAQAKAARAAESEQAQAAKTLKALLSEAEEKLQRVHAAPAPVPALASGAAPAPTPALPNLSSAQQLLPADARETGGGMATPRTKAATSLQRVQRGHRSRRMGAIA